MTLFAQVDEGTTCPAGVQSQAGVGMGGEPSDHAAEEKGGEGQVPGEVDGDAEDAEDAAADHPPDRHRARLAEAQKPFPRRRRAWLRGW